MDDPDLGLRTYTYNPLGLLSSETDAKNQVTRYSYDKLGRQIGRVDDATGSSLSHLWAYVTTGNGKGRLLEVSGKDTDGANYSETYNYDSLSRLVSTNTNIKGSAYLSGQNYDAMGRVRETVYPTGYSVHQHYNQYGYPLRFVSGDDGTVVWEANTIDARGNITQFTLGNGVVTNQSFDAELGHLQSIHASRGGFVIQSHQYDFDSLGNLSFRKDLKFGPQQTLNYDNLNRLKGSGGVQETNYDALGNITSKLGVGTYSYGQGANAGPQNQGVRVLDLEFLI